MRDITSDLLPHDHACPAWLLRDLRTIDPAATLIYIGRGRWWLGVVKSGWEDTGAGARMQDGMKALGLELAKPPEQRNWWRIARAKLKARGFRYIAQYAGEPTSRIVRAFEECDYNYRTRFAAIEAEINRESDGTAGTERIMRGASDAGRYLARDAWRHKVNKPHSVSLAGATH
jgi:hypothetical protein